MKILGSNILIVPEYPEESTIITTTVDKSPTGYGTVVVVGEDVRGVNNGDKIFYNKNAGRFIGIDEEEHLLITETDVFIILNKEQK